MVPSIYHLHPLVAGRLENWSPHLERIARMGFNHVCLAPPFAPCGDGDLFLPGDLEALHPALGATGSVDAAIAQAAKSAERAGLHLILDIVLDRVSVDSPLLAAHPDWFVAADGDVLPDPRRNPKAMRAARASFDAPEVSDDLALWWLARLTRLLDAGVSGFRCLRPHRVPDSVWRPLIGTIVRSHPDCLFLAWIDGLQPTELAGLEGVGFTATGLSIAHGLIDAPRLADELEAARLIGSPVLAPEPSFSDRLVATLSADTDAAAAYRQALMAAASLGQGLFLPMGFEFISRRRFDPARADPDDLRYARSEAIADLSADVAAANAMAEQVGACGINGTIRALTPPGAAVAAWLRVDADDTSLARRGLLTLVNPDLLHSAVMPFSADCLPPGAGAPFGDPSPILAQNGMATPMAPREVRVLACKRLPDIVSEAPPTTDWRKTIAGRIAIEAMTPAVPDRAFPAKAVVGAAVAIAADIVADGHDQLAASLLWRAEGETAWQRCPMRKTDNDRWEAAFIPDRIGLYQFTVEAWWDRWSSFVHDLHAKHEAGQPLSLEAEEGRNLIQQAAERAQPSTRQDLTRLLEALCRQDVPARVALLLSEEAAQVMRAADDQPFCARHDPPLPLRADRPKAVFSNWYELFPRSVTADPARHGTLRDVIGQLPRIRAMGFDVIYFPPIHPIGRVNRKGRNNRVLAEPNDVGSPWAIGSAEGGHDAVNPLLGSVDDLRQVIAAAHRYGIEIALDFAIQCAPDHPWLRQHPDWFRWRPDGSLRYAENPPKKYEDIVNPDFYAEAAVPALWLALRDVIQFWVDQGIRIFRVDNPHTKPFPFWRWMIADIQARHPDVLFLSEAFTRPKVMYRLAKLGFSQSYTYFTWRNTKQEMTEYLTELTREPVRDFFRPNFFVNTPDINPFFLQTSGRAGFLTRAALAATLSGSWGMYSGFEICEAAPLPGREEYLDSEKYQIRPRAFGKPGNIVAEITALNRIRRAHPALQTHLGLTFYQASNERILLYGKRAPATQGIVLVAVSLDPHDAQEATIESPLWEFGLPDHGALSVTDLMCGTRFVWHGKYQHIRLDPHDLPFGIWQLSPSGAG